MKQPIWSTTSRPSWGLQYYQFISALKSEKAPSNGEPVLLIENEPMKWYGLPFPLLIKFDRVEGDNYGPYDKNGDRVSIDNPKKIKLYSSSPNNFSRDEVLISVGMSYRSSIRYWIIGKDAVHFEEPIIMDDLKVPQIIPISKGRNFQRGNFNLSQDGLIVYGEDLEIVLRETDAHDYLKWMTAKNKLYQI